VDSINSSLELSGFDLTDVKGIGIGSPGPLNARMGTILKAGNLPHWDGFPLADNISSIFGVPVHIQNDATLFAYGEWWKGAGRGVDHFFAVTLGTGLGGGIVSGGKLITGFNDNAGEIGHTTVDYNGVQCWCGQKGCIEMYASATGLVRMTIEELVNEHVESVLVPYRKKPAELSAKIITEAAETGDRFALMMLDRAGYLLGIALVNALNILNYEVAAVGGGLARAGDFILAPARRALTDRGFMSYNKLVSIVPAERPDEAAILGAAKLVMDMLEQK
jgi:glucokinase